MTIDDFRRIALSLPGVEELSGLGYPNFRAGRKSFATIEDSAAIVRLTRAQQSVFVAKAPEVFASVSSGWGLLGRTIIRLEKATEETMIEALTTAWNNVAGSGSVVPIIDAPIGFDIDVDTNPAIKAAEKHLDEEAAKAHEAANVPEAAEAKGEGFGRSGGHLEGVTERLQLFWGPKRE